MSQGPKGDSYYETRQSSCKTFTNHVMWETTRPVADHWPILGVWHLSFQWKMSLLFPISPPQQAVYQVKCIAFINNSGLKLKFAVSISAGTRLTCWVAPGQKCRPPIKPLGSLHSMYSLSLTKYNLLTILWPRGKFLTVPVGSSSLCLLVIPALGTVSVWIYCRCVLWLDWVWGASCLYWFSTVALPAPPN